MINTINKTNDIIIRYKELMKSSSNDYIATDDYNTIALAFKYGLNVEEFFYCNEIDYHNETLVIIEALKSYASHTSYISMKTCDYLANKDNCVGLFAIIKIDYSGVKSIMDKDFLVVCDELEIPGNLGTIYRTIDSAKADGMILVNSVTHPYSNKTTVAARGCNLLVPTWDTNFEEAYDYLSLNGYDIYLGEPVLGQDYQSYDYSGKIAIVVGSERFGIDPRWYEKKNKHIKKVFIPMYGSNNSLNVSVAASILIYEARMKRNKIENNK